MDLLTIICLNYPINLNDLISVAVDTFTKEYIISMQVLSVVLQELDLLN